MKHGVDVSDEMWMHVKPDKEELRRWRHRKCCDFGEHKGGSETDVDKNAEDELEYGADAAQDVDESTSQNESGREAPAEGEDTPTADSQNTWLGTHPGLAKEGK